MPTLVYRGGPQDGVEHRVPGKPPPVRLYASPGARASVGWVSLARYTAREAVRRSVGLAYVYEYTGTHTVQSPLPATGCNGGDVIEGWN